MGRDYVLEMRGITKCYGENTVLEDVALTVRPGEIHALLGENGAGKSTLMNVLFGMPVIHNTGGFAGEVLLSGEPTRIASPHDAMGQGIGMVHQEFMLLPGFTIAENIKLNREITRPNLFSRTLRNKDLETLDMPTMAGDARRALDSVGMGIEEYTLVKGLPVGYMQFVEIAREIDKTGIKLMVFDEPTAVLTESEAEQLIRVMKQIAASGIAIIFITHRLDEVMAAADSITILRDGKLAATRKVGETNIVELAELMIGRKEGDMAHAARSERHSDVVALEAKHLSVDMPGEDVKDVSLTVYEGEILGIGGLAGQGKLGIPNGIMGLYPAQGQVTFFGKPHALGDARAALTCGMAMVSEDRRGVGLLLDQSIEDNIAFNAMQIKGEYLYKFGPLTNKNGRAIRKTANEMIALLDIRCTGATQHTGTLSGGNQQKVCVARALTMNPKFLFVSEPTRGIDIGAKKLVLDTLVRLNRELNMTIVMVSSELMELRSVCDRIAIVSEGEVVDVLTPDRSAADFGLAMSGIVPGTQEGGEAHG
ncbi:MAG: sugar ABC transporter ATP-binding protein [Christensenellaceae bacterium]|nr:sugar ABC transporter ATP-binding protein [Christensenellaceae bacterium]MEA5067381.1 sugar ABC transporter ATP-binding protein [Christensenellaceae bacterium]